MPLIHVQDIEPMADHIRNNIVKYLVEHHDIPILDSDAERDLYNFILLTAQNYMLHPPPIIQKKSNRILIFVIILILSYIVACLFR